jgi:ABC-type multidrug transport system fused ATPase/permease subunit
METDAQPTQPNPKRRWFYPTPGRLLVVLLALEGILLLSERFQWIPTGWSVLIASASVGITIVLMLLWFIFALIFHWRFQFSIRSLLLLTVIVAILCSWITMQKVFGDDFFGTVANVNFTSKETIFDTALNRNLTYFSNVHVTDYDLKPLEGLKELKYLHLEKTKVTDDDLVHLEGLNQLKLLVLTDTKVTGEGVRKLKKALPNCKIEH